MCTCIYCVFVLFRLCIFFVCFCLIMEVMYFYCCVYVFLLLCMFCSVHSVFIVPTGTLRLPWLRFSVFILSCKANAGVKLAKTVHGLHSSQINCVVLCTVCVWMCTVLLPPGVNPIAVNKYIYIYLYYLKLLLFSAFYSGHHQTMHHFQNFRKCIQSSFHLIWGSFMAFLYFDRMHGLMMVWIEGRELRVLAILYYWWFCCMTAY